MNDPERTGDWQKPLPDVTRSLNSPTPGDDVTRSALAPDSHASDMPAASKNDAQAIGRYRVEKILGEGGFGVVYLAYDDELKRRVAIKVPQAHRIRSPNDAEAYLVEAQILATLDHPHIVPVYDVGRSENGLPFVVSKFIEGCNLAERIKESRLPVRECVLLVARMAEALQYAHQHRLVHRDVKPGNILLDESKKPFLVDFGLALKEEDFGKGSGLSGTPAYMSPEQANGEGHLVDGRSDIYSLGVVFYELLTGRRPFEATNITQLLSLITSVEPRPLRQIDPAIPKELERITLKALAKRASERYPTALDFADDLQHWLKPETTTEKGPASVRIIPKGLRSFDAGDTEFFLELLPGPRDRDGLPETLRFWKTRIEETDADKTFRVGVIYGPSGCGKSSFMKAGLLPRLADTVRRVYVEATPDGTETRLLRGLKKACPDLSNKSSLREAITHLRRTERLRHKLVLVVDQFEQWLHGKNNQENAELIQALRQCDGERVQCIVMVRDDFWLAVSRFVKTLDIRIVEGQNAALVDLFDLRHAQKVLTAFGKAYGTLPENGVLTGNQETFLEKAVSGLAQEGKVICVRLALFAEMMKGKAWTPASLKAVGGTEGVGVTFLEETFSATTAPPEHRYHQKAARGILKALLPETGSDIKGHMRSYAELLVASGYSSRPKDFDDLIGILDSEIRLITPTDPEGKEDSTPSTLQAGAKYYQLTHDYLVHSLRDWLTRKQKETRRGRAELLLVDRAGVWNARPENRQLPSLWQWFNIRWWTQKKNWTPPQKKMMTKAGKYHAVRAMVVAVLLAVATITGLVIRDQVEEQRKAHQAAELVIREQAKEQRRAHQAAELVIREQAEEQRKATQAAGLVQAVLNANTAQVPAIIGEMSGYRKWVDPLLREASDKAAAKSRQKLHASLALLPVDATQVAYLYGRLLQAASNEVPVIRDALAPHKDALLDKLWAVAEGPDKGKESQRLQAASALAKYDPESERWTKAQEGVGNDLVAVPAVYLFLWLDSLRPVRTKLLPQLSAVYRNGKRQEVERWLATDILTDYAADQPEVLADLVMDADKRQFALIFPKLKDCGEQCLPVLTAEIDKKFPPDLPSSDKRREKLAKRQANAAVALLRLKQPARVWPLLKQSPDQRVRSYLIHRLCPLGADAEAIVKRLDSESDLTISRALLLSLGEFGEKDLPPEARKSLLPKLQGIYRTEVDAGLHASAEWLLRTWKEETWLKQVNDEWAKDKEQREKRLHGIVKALAKDKDQTTPQWYVNSQRQTMVVIPGPVEFLMGSPPTEANRRDDETQHKRRISRTFAIAATAVTKEQFLRFRPTFGHNEMKRYPEATCPIGGVTWYEAAAYCNWLSKEERIPEAQWCYEIKGSVTKLKENYLSLSGYRLPTEAEMEYAARATALTSRCYGENEELLAKYAWYLKNSQEKTWPVGSLRPNDLGLFDVHGSVYTWCQGSFRAYLKEQMAEPSEDRVDRLDINNEEGRVLRGGSFASAASVVRSADRAYNLPTLRLCFIGFRLARTLAP